MTQQLVLKETGFYLQDSSLRVGERGLRALLLRALFSQETQNFPCSPPGYKPNHAQKFPTSLSVLRLAAQTGLHPLWNMHLWVSESPSSRSSRLLQDLGYIILSFHVVVQGNMSCVTLDHGGVQGGIRLKRMTSPYVLHRSRSLQLNSPSSVPSAPNKSVLG